MTAPVNNHITADNFKDLFDQYKNRLYGYVLTIATATPSNRKVDLHNPHIGVAWLANPQGVKTTNMITPLAAGA